MLRPSAMCAPSPTGLFPALPGVSPPLGGAGVWADRLIVNSVIVISAAIDFVIFFMILLFWYVETHGRASLLSDLSCVFFLYPIFLYQISDARLAGEAGVMFDL